MRGRAAISACPGPCDTLRTVKHVTVALVLASVVLAAVLVCPCAAMAVEAHGCCADDGPSIRPSACCHPQVVRAPWTPAATGAAPVVSFAPVTIFVTMFVSSAPLPSFVSFPASPPRVLRI